MISPELIRVMHAINDGDKARARQLLTPILKSNPSAEAWYQASRLTEKLDHELNCLRQALGLDPLHVEARRRFRELEEIAGLATPPPPTPQFTPRPAPAAAPTSAVHEAAQPVRPCPKPPEIIPSDVPLKRTRRQKRKRGAWFYVGIGAALIGSLTATYFVLTVLGSPIPGQITGAFTGQHPVTEIDGVPLEQIPDAVYKIEPIKSTALTQSEAKAAALEPGIVHEYTFEAYSGEEIALGVQFFSPTAQQVNRNIAILDPMGKNADSQCQRSRILQGDNGTAMICNIDRTGTWQVRILGRTGESTGAYVVSIERMYDQAQTGTR